MNLMGNFNSWSRQADPMHMVDDFTWQTDLDLEPQESLAFVFLADGSLEKQWGEDDSDHPQIPVRGVAGEMGGSIRIDGPLSGPHRFTFHEETGEFSVEPVPATELAPLPAVPPPRPVEEIRRITQG